MFGGTGCHRNKSTRKFDSSAGIMRSIVIRWRLSREFFLNDFPGTCLKTNYYWNTYFEIDIFLISHLFFWPPLTRTFKKADDDFAVAQLTTWRLTAVMTIALTSVSLPISVPVAGPRRISRPKAFTSWRTCLALSVSLLTSLHTGPFLYPSFAWAYAKIERSIKQMGEAGTRVPASGAESNEEWLKRGLNAAAWGKRQQITIGKGLEYVRRTKQRVNFLRSFFEMPSWG